jgi:hypothetical protein
MVHPAVDSGQADLQRPSEVGHVTAMWIHALHPGEEKLFTERTIFSELVKNAVSLK